MHVNSSLTGLKFWDTNLDTDSLYLCKWQGFGQNVVVGPALHVGLAELRHGEEQDADDDVEGVEGRQHHHEPVELELVLQPHEQDDGRDVADEAEDADGHEQDHLEDELHRLLVVDLIVPVLRGRVDVDGRVHDGSFHRHCLVFWV